MNRYQQSLTMKLASSLCTLLVAVFSLVKSAIAKIDSLVEVYDNVLSEETAKWLHEECIKWSASEDNAAGTLVLAFPLKAPERHSPIEQLLNQILVQLYPNVTEPTYHVEFWSRRQWSHIWGHQDMDEEWDRQTHNQPNTALSSPETGHVLYLNVGKAVQGPTVLWNVSTGGELADADMNSMIVVPAVQGRLLRFQGHLLHGVPRPADVYFSHVYEEDNDPQFERSVLLFNTWRKESSLVDAIVLNATSSNSEPVPKKCNNKKEWRQVELVDHQPPDQFWLDNLIIGQWKEMEVPLMGDARRRGQEKRFAFLDAPLDAVEVLKEPSQVTSMSVRPTKTRLFGFEL